MNFSNFMCFGFKSLSSRVAWLAFGAGLFTSLDSLGEPFVPKDEAEVLERVPAPTRDPLAREFQQVRSKLASEPANLPQAVDVAKRWIARARMEGDPRCLGYAEATLLPWWNLPQPPVEVLVLRATIRQSNHDFDRALADLDQALKIQPANAQALLTRAVILQVQGRFDEARPACFKLAGLASPLIATACAGSLASLTGSASNACEQLQLALERDPKTAPEEKLWATTLLAEIHTRLGRFEEAEKRFREGLAITPADPYLLGAFADFLLDRRRAGEAVPLLREFTKIDGLLLRLALAEQQLAPRSRELERHVTTLRQRFEASRLRGDNIHQREEARFALHLADKPAEALRLAQENWKVQREPADARIFLEAALAAREPKAAGPVLEFLRSTKLEDVHLAELIRQFNPVAANSTLP